MAAAWLSQARHSCPTQRTQRPSGRQHFRLRRCVANLKLTDAAEVSDLALHNVRSHTLTAQPAIRRSRVTPHEIFRSLYVANMIIAREIRACLEPG